MGIVNGWDWRPQFKIFRLGLGHGRDSDAHRGGKKKEKIEGKIEERLRAHSDTNSGMGEALMRQGDDCSIAVADWLFGRPVSQKTGSKEFTRD